MDINIFKDILFTGAVGLLFSCAVFVFGVKVMLAS